MLTPEQKIAEAMLLFERCENYTPEHGEPCDGLMGCQACIALAAKAIVRALGLDGDA
jgi:hypothetical protein